MKPSPRTKAHDGGQQYLRLPRHEVLAGCAEKERTASIINISFISARGLPHFIAYGAAKAAVRSYHECRCALPDQSVSHSMQ